MEKKCEYCKKKLTLMSSLVTIKDSEGNERHYHFPCHLLEKLDKRIETLEKINNMNDVTDGGI